MRNEVFRLTPKDSQESRVSWEAPGPDWVSWVFVNGKHVAGPFYAGQVQRSVRIPHPAGKAIALEIHDFPDDTEPVAPAVEAPNTRPDLLWNSVAGAVRYRIYHRVKGGAEEKIYDQPAEEGIDRHRIACPIRLEGEGGVWHFFRVEAVNAFGYESTRQAWTFFARDLPAPAGNLEVTDGSAPGLFDFEIQ